MTVCVSVETPGSSSATRGFSGSDCRTCLKPYLCASLPAVAVDENLLYWGPPGHRYVQTLRNCSSAHRKGQFGKDG
jgi:hypothetical protein